MDHKTLARDRQKIFESFMKMAAYSVVAVVITLALMAFFLT